MTESYGKCIHNFTKYGHVALQNGTYQKCVRALISLHPNEHLILSDSVIFADLMDTSYYLFCIYLIIISIEKLLVYALATQFFFL